MTGAAILTHVGIAAPAADQTAWAATCAAAVDAAIRTRTAGTTIAAGSAGDLELVRAALVDGAAAYLDRDAPHGILSLGADGQAVRLGADILRACVPVLTRYVLPGIG